MAGLTRWTTGLIWLLLLAALAACAAFSAQWLATLRINAAIRARSVETLKPLPADARARYAAAWDLERSQHFDQAIALFTEVQADGRSRTRGDGVVRARQCVLRDRYQDEPGLHARRTRRERGVRSRARCLSRRTAHRSAALRRTLQPRAAGASRAGAAWRRLATQYRPDLDPAGPAQRLDDDPGKREAGAA